MATVLQYRYGLTLAGDLLDRVTCELRDRLPAGIGHDAVFESIRYLAGRVLTPTEALQLAWRLSGNIPALRAGVPVRPWAIQSQDEWVPLQIIQSLAAKNKRNVIGTQFSFRVLAGSPCPLRISAFWKDGLVRLAAGKFGFSRPNGKYPFVQANELVGLRFLGKVIAARSTSGSPVFWDIECPDPIVKWNRDNVLKLRFRRDGQECPRNWLHPCRQCVVGFDQCPAGTHYRTYEVGFCDGCGEPNKMFDPELGSPHCIQCCTRERLRRTQ